MADGLLDDIDTVVIPGGSGSSMFKKKVVKGKKSSQRVKISFDEHEDDDDNEAISLVKKSTKSSHKFTSSGNNRSSRRAIVDRAKSWMRSEVSVENDGDDATAETLDSFVKTLSTDEDVPVVEDIDSLLRRDSPETENGPSVHTQYFPLETTEKKYVPIEHNKEPKITAKQYRNEYDNDLDDNESHIDDLDDDVKAVSNEKDDYIADNDDLDLTGNKVFQINNDVYDLELSNDASDMSDSSSVHMEFETPIVSNKPVKTLQILSITDQISAMKLAVDDLKETIQDQKTELKACTLQAEQVRKRKDELQLELNS